MTTPPPERPFGLVSEAHVWAAVVIACLAFGFAVAAFSLALVR
jgi:hypothetical protein